MRYAVPVVLLTGVLGLAGCGGDPSEPSADPTRTPAETSTGTPTSPATTEGATGTPTAAAGLDWQPVPGPVTDSVTSNGDWTLTVDEAGTKAVLAGPRPVPPLAATGRERVAEALLSDTHAVVVLADQQETRPHRAVVTDLASGQQTVVDGRSDVPTTTGGTWALGPDSVVHATVTRQGKYCLATVDLATGAGTRGWCAPPRHGFNRAAVTEAGTALLTFDDSRPSCRTVGSVEGTSFTPFEGVPECKGWEAVVLDGSTVWSVVPKETAVEAVEMQAGVGGEVVDLGPGTGGTLTACGGAAYFVRDPQREGDPAQLMRWDGEQVTAVYESKAGPAFIDKPRCAGDVLTLTSLAEGGDEQVTARVG